MFIDNLIKAIELRKTNKTALAKKINIAKTSYKKWENGSSPKFDTVIKIAEELNVSLDYLAYGEEKKIYGEIETLYNKATTEDKKVIDLLLSKYKEAGQSYNSKIG